MSPVVKGAKATQVAANRKKPSGHATMRREMTVSFQMDNMYFDDLRALARLVLDREEIPDFAEVTMHATGLVDVTW